MTDGLSRRSVPHTLHGIVEFTSTARVLVWASMLLDIAANCRYFRLPVWKLSRFESGLLGMLTYGLSRLSEPHTLHQHGPANQQRWVFGNRILLCKRRRFQRLLLKYRNRVWYVLRHYSR